MFCQNCGTKLNDDANFCPACGNKIELPKRTCAKCGAELEEGTKFCAVCGEPIPQAALPITEKMRSAVSTAASTVAPVAERARTSVAAAVHIGNAKKRWKIIVPMALALVAIIIISSVSAVAAAEAKKPWNRLLLAAHNTLKEENFTIDVSISEDGDYRNSYTYSMDYVPDDHLALGEDGELSSYFTEAYFFTPITSEPFAVFAEDIGNFSNDPYLEWHRWFGDYYWTNALGKFLLGDKTYVDDMSAFIDGLTENDRYNDYADLSDVTAKQAIGNFQELLLDEEFLKNACDYQLLEGSTVTSVTINIDRYSDFWIRFVDCLSPILTEEDVDDMRDALCTGDYSLEAKLDIRDGKISNCSFEITYYWGSGRDILSMDISLSRFGTTRMSGLDSPQKMDQKAERFRAQYSY